jgi:D-3-phosphoglycerate dehydrogenase / 2-oxoglutarate reductase
VSVIDATVLVTARSFGDGDPELRPALERAVREVRYNDLARALTAAELRARLDGVDGLLAGLDDVDADALASPGLRVVARYGTGVDRVDLDAARRHGVTVTNTPGANAAAVAEHTLALMLMLCRPLVASNRAVRDGRWPTLTGTELGRRTVGLMGAGEIGSRVARAAAGIGCRVLAHDPLLDDARARELGARRVALDELVEQAGVLSLHAPLTDETRAIVDDELLGRLQAGALLVNTARGELVDEAALVRALDGGRLAGAALDTLCEEPPPAGHPLVGRDDVIVTSHIGAHTHEASAAMGRLAMEDLLNVLAGRPPRYAVVAPERPA